MNKRKRVAIQKHRVTRKKMEERAKVAKEAGHPVEAPSRPARRRSGGQ